MNDLSSQLNSLRVIATEAGARILAVYNGAFDVTRKDDDSPLTEADRASHELILQRLTALTPDIPVLSEESAAADYAIRSGWKRFWLVDPLDGTKEFIKRNGEFTVNIALIEAGAPVMGVVHVPVRQETYFGARGQGAFLEQNREVRRLQARAFSGGRAVVVASRSHAGKETEEFLQNIGEHDVVSMGSSLKLCLVAAGAADVYPRLGPTMEWDTAAAHCVVTEAGGRVIGVDGRSLVYNKPDLHNPWFIVTGAGAHDWTRHLPQGQ